jgi:CRP-like cAMP-binding protein
LGDDVLGELAGLCKKVRVEEGDVIVDENEIGKELFLIKEGRVRIVGQRGSKNETVFSELGAGEFFGEMCVIESVPRSASVLAAESTLLYSLAAADIKRLGEKRPDQFSILLLNIGRDLCRRLRVMNKLFATLLPLTRNSAASQPLAADAGDVGA